jgi:hypothetical protein
MRRPSEFDRLAEVVDLAEDIEEIGYPATPDAWRQE